MNKIIPIVLSGGSGTRLWPLSRKQYPKQYLPLIGENTMLQETLLRLNGLVDFEDVIIVCNADHRFIVAEQCRKIGINNPKILLEPEGKNTAPAIVAATLYSQKLQKNPALLILSADHAIQDVKKFHRVISSACEQLHQKKIITFGITPTEANTDYGYIEFINNSGSEFFQVTRFVEKPSKEIANLYLRKGNYLWNSGMFIFQSSVLINEMKQHSPSTLQTVKKAIEKSTQDLDFVRLDRNSFDQLTADSIDYALMEKSKNIIVLPLDAQWSDVGSWSALYDIGIKDNNNNVIKGNVIVKNTKNAFINSNSGVVATLGVKDLVIVNTEDVVLIAGKDRTKDIKSMVELVKKSDPQKIEAHRKVYRPWGWYDSIESGNNFQVKRLYINPNAKLSLQMHQKRAEHWVVLSGVATVTKGTDEMVLEKGDSTYIPRKTLHSIENREKTPLEVIEVQSGSYLGEDDIERFEDIYNRVD